MSSYISSQQNRYYCALEQIFGIIPAVSAGDRVAGFGLKARQTFEIPERRDKTGSRTFPGVQSGLRRSTTFEFTSGLTPQSISLESGVSAIVSAAMGGICRTFSGAVVAGSNGFDVTTSSPHSLVKGQAVRYQNQLRFVKTVNSDTAFTLCNPFEQTLQTGWHLGTTRTYWPGDSLPSLSIFDYWSPKTAVQRIVCGAVVDDFRITVNGDWLEFKAKGVAADLVDSSSFLAGNGGLTQYPAEPTATGLGALPVPGHLGQFWAGEGSPAFRTLLEAEFSISNNVDARLNEFGGTSLSAVFAGPREVGLQIRLYEKDDEQTQTLYRAAKLRVPIPVSCQLGNQETALCGIYLPAVVPTIPEFEDDGARLAWSFSESMAQGEFNDEITIAFG